MQNDTEVRRYKKSSVWAYTRFPEINENVEEEEEDSNEEDLKGQAVHRRTQILAAVAANMGALALGTALSWPAVALPSLRIDPEIGNLTKDDQSWIGSIVSLGAVAAGPVGGAAIEIIGRRGAMLSLSLPFFLSWILIYFATSLPMILVGRFFTGFFAGTFAVAAPIFTAEVTDIGIRGGVGSTFDMMISVGILFIYILGTFLSWRAQALVCSIIPVIIFFLMIIVPESPFYLVKKGKINHGINSLMQYRGTNKVVQIKSEFEDIVAESENIKYGISESGGIRRFCAPYILIPVFIGFMVYLFQVISGLDPVLIYTVDIFDLAGADLNDYASTIIVGTMQTLAGVVAASVVDRSGRRFLLLLSESLMIVALIFLGLYFYLKQLNGGVPPPNLGWLPVTTLAVYVLSYSVGLGPVGYTLMGEILPLQVKGLAGCILTSAKWFMSFLVTKFFQDIMAYFGEAGCFWLFACLCGAGFIFIFFMVPETKGKSLEDIQREFRGKFGIRLEFDPEETSPLITDTDENRRASSSVPNRSGYETI